MLEFSALTFRRKLVELESCAERRGISSWRVNEGDSKGGCWRVLARTDRFFFLEGSIFGFAGSPFEGIGWDGDREGFREDCGFYNWSRMYLEYFFFFMKEDGDEWRMRHSKDRWILYLKKLSKFNSHYLILQWNFSSKLYILAPKLKIVQKIVIYQIIIFDFPIIPFKRQ